VGKRRPALLLTSVLAAAMLAYCALNLRVGTDITRFLPVGSSSELAVLSSRLSDSALTRTVIVSLGAGDVAVAIAAAGELTEALRSHPEVAWIRSQVDATDLEQLYRLYFPRRLGFLSDQPERLLPERLTDAALRARARELRLRLASPASGFFEPLIATDPLGAFEGLVARLRSGESSLRMRDGQLVTPDERFAVVLLGTRGSAFDSGTQAGLLAFLRASFDDVAKRHPGRGLELEVSAFGAFAVAAERSIRGDVHVIAACSFLGVALLFAIFVGSLRGFVVVTIPPLAGMLVATTLGLLLFGRLDGLTLAFGTSLMGIVIDYSNHLLLHHGLGRPPETPERVAARLRPTLVLGALTTVASFVGLGITPFPAFREMSFFAVTGVLSGLAVSLWLLPALLGGVPALPERSARIAALLDAAFGRLMRLPAGLRFAPLALCAAAVAALPAIHWSDDLSRLTQFDPELVAEDRRVRERVAQLDGARFVIALAPDAEAAVALNDVIHARLERVAAAGGLDDTRSLHALLWSRELQQRNAAVLSAAPDLGARIDAAFAAEGFRPGGFRDFAEELRAPAPAPLELADLQASPFADLLTPFVFDLGDRIAVITYLRGLRDPDAVRAAIDDLEDVHLLEQRSFVNDIYREFRETSLRQILLGGGLVLLLLALRYRAWRPVLAAFLPSALVAVLVLAALAALGEAVNLLHVMSLVMVMGMGVDYGIFCVDSVGRRESFGTTLASLLLSCLTTTFVFGALALSEQPALRAIGITTGIGVLLSFLLAPVVVAAAGMAPGSSDSRG
jgi:predicted exporter